MHDDDGYYVQETEGECYFPALSAVVVIPCSGHQQPRVQVSLQQGNIPPPPGCVPSCAVPSGIGGFVTLAEPSLDTALVSCNECTARPIPEVSHPPQANVHQVSSSNCVPACTVQSLPPVAHLSSSSLHVPSSISGCSTLAEPSLDTALVSCHECTARPIPEVPHPLQVNFHQVRAPPSCVPACTAQSSPLLARSSLHAPSSISGSVERSLANIALVSHHENRARLMPEVTHPLQANVRAPPVPALPHPQRGPLMMFGALAEQEALPLVTLAGPVANFVQPNTVIGNQPLLNESAQQPGNVLPFRALAEDEISRELVEFTRYN